MRYRLFTVTAFALLTTYIFGGFAMASDMLENLTGTWAVIEENPKKQSTPYLFQDAGSSTNPYKIIIDDDKIVITYRNEVICDTIFRRDGNELKNTKKRKNWEDYVEMHQHEQFAHFERIEFLDGVLTAFIFIADMGFIKVPFAKIP